MKVLLLSIAMIFSSVGAWAANGNPWARVCKVSEGTFWVLYGGEEHHSMCFFGSAAIGAEALFLFKTNSGTSQAIEAYKNRKNSSPRGGICGSFNSNLVQAQDSDGRTFNLCQFADKSLIEETTLWLGPGIGANESLDKALSNTY